jgi:large subunit ribosomal protein L3
MGAIINRVFKGKLLPGRMGNNVRTMQNLLVVAVDLENNVILIKGNVPGANKSFVTIKATVKGTSPIEINLGAVKQPEVAPEVVEETVAPEAATEVVEATEAPVEVTTPEVAPEAEATPSAEETN